MIPSQLFEVKVTLGAFEVFLSWNRYVLASLQQSNFVPDT